MCISFIIIGINSSPPDPYAYQATEGIQALRLKVKRLKSISKNSVAYRRNKEYEKPPSLRSRGHLGEKCKAIVTILSVSFFLIAVGSPCNWVFCVCLFYNNQYQFFTPRSLHLPGHRGDTGSEAESEKAPRRIKELRSTSAVQKEQRVQEASNPSEQRTPG